MSVATPQPIQYVVRPNSKAIKARRYELGIDAQDLAAQADISPAFMSAIERGIRTPRAPVLKRLADALGLTVAQITTMQTVDGDTG